MTLRQYLLFMTAATLLCFGALYFVMMSVDPYTASAAGLSLFFVALFLSLFGLFSLIVFAIESFFSRSETVAFRMVRKSFRQAVLFSVLVTVVLLMARAQYLYWWTLILLAVIVSCVEFLWSSRSSHHS
ncbi:MAG: hypothetical protein AAB384_00985 [Patescibacteria group bacterium]